MKVSITTDVGWNAILHAAEQLVAVAQCTPQSGDVFARHDADRLRRLAGIIDRITSGDDRDTNEREEPNR